MRKESVWRLRRIAGWVLFLYGVFGGLYQLFLGPMQLLYSLPVTILFMAGGGAFIRWGRSKPPMKKS